MEKWLILSLITGLLDGNVNFLYGALGSTKEEII